MRTTLLLVDDHAGFRARARVMLEAEGFDVVGEAADGRSGLAMAERLHPDVALVDVQLPDISGFEVAAGLRTSDSARRIILISGRDEAEYGERAARSSADGFIAKADLSGDMVRAASG